MARVKIPAIPINVVAQDCYANGRDAHNSGDLFIRIFGIHPESGYKVLLLFAHFSVPQCLPSMIKV